MEGYVPLKKLLALTLLLLFTLQCFAAIAPTSIKLDITEKSNHICREMIYPHSVAL